jgi:diguanylate cyclase (GGDEF)-like protein
VSVSNNYKEEFVIGITRINITRGKIASITIIALEVMMLIASLIIKRDSFLKKPDIYYGVMYILLLIFMIIYLLIFNKLENSITEYGTSIRFVQVSYISFILFWSLGISLLDQFSSGQIIVYTVAIIVIAVTAIFKPVTLLLVYLITHASFLVLLPYFQKSNEMLFGNYVNGTSFLIISWAISCTMYRKQVNNFNNEKVIHEKSDELKQVNKDLKEANQKLEKLSQTDSLTGIFNRYVFETILKSEWDRCKHHFIPLSLIMIDIDFFKAFNDNYGHRAGDDCIRQVSGALSACARNPSDIVSRYGGEEFAVILTYKEKESVLEFAEQLRKKVEQMAIPHMYSSISKYITISLGVYTLIPSDESSIEEFIRTADKALYQAKKERNNIVVA